MKFLGSSNFWNNFIVLLAGVFMIFGAPFPEEAGMDFVKAVFSRQLGAIVVAGFTLGNSLFHIFKTYDLKGSIKDVFSSKNFWTNVVTVVTAAFQASGVEFPSDQALALRDAIFSGDLSLIVMAGFNLVNILYQLFKNKGAGLRPLNVREDLRPV